MFRRNIFWRIRPGCPAQELPWSETTVAYLARKYPGDIYFSMEEA